jgi:hypothetical protein
LALFTPAAVASSRLEQVVVAASLIAFSARKYTGRRATVASGMRALLTVMTLSTVAILLHSRSL